MNKISLILGVLLLSAYAKGENILIMMGVASPSHHIWISTLASGLAEKSNHNVTVLSPNRDKNAPKNVHYIYMENIYEKIYADAEQFDLLKMPEMSSFQEIDVFVEFFTEGCSHFLRSNGIQELINYPKDFKFDLIINDLTCGPCLLFFMEQFNNPPLIAVTPFLIPPYVVDYIGGHNYYAYYPYFNLNYDALDMTFAQRFYNFLVYTYSSWIMRNYAVPIQDQSIRDILKIDFPYLGKLQQKTVLALVNSHPAADLPQPLGPNVIPVGGLQIKEPKALPHDIEAFINKSVKGTVLFSLGTNIKSDQLGATIQIELLNAFAQLPEYNFLWKFETDTLPIEPSKNVMVRPWLPQNDLLGHPKIVLFITHAGGLSTLEASWYGVPMVGIPFLGDQHRNLHRAVKAGIAEKIDFSGITTEIVKEKVLKVLETPSYRNNIQLRSTRFRDQKEHPLDRALWWIDWVLRNPQPDHIQSPVLKLGYIRSNSYDVVAAIVVSFVIVILLSVKLICFCLKFKGQRKRKLD